MKYTNKTVKQKSTIAKVKKVNGKIIVSIEGKMVKQK